MFLHLRRAVEKILRNRNETIEIISHMDADGVCAAAILSKALERKNIEHNVRFVRMLYRDVVEQINPAEFTIFADLGSSQLGNLKPWRGRETIICDHHPPEAGEKWDGSIHLNAHFFGLDGAREISGSGMAYLLCRLLGENRDLAKLALLGAVGDVQNLWGKLEGYNRRILAEAEGEVEVREDLLLFGKYTRPLFKSVMGFCDPFVPGLSNSTVGAVSLLKELGIPQQEGRRWRRVADLTPEEKRALAEALRRRAVSVIPPELSPHLPHLIWGETYLLVREEENSPLHDASEFATCLNSTARHEQPRVGFELARGDRGPYYRTMTQLLCEYRKFLSKALEVLQNEGVKTGPGGKVQFFDLTGVIRESFVGTLAGLALSSGVCDPYKPILGMVREGGIARISARCSKLLLLRGIDLASIMKKTAESVGGEGGGHSVACGAQIPGEKTGAFIEGFEELLPPVDIGDSNHI